MLAFWAPWRRSSGRELFREGCDGRGWVLFLGRSAGPQIRGHRHRGPSAQEGGQCL